MVWKIILLWIIGISSGIMVSAGVFTVLFVVGLVPRFAGRTDTARFERNKTAVKCRLMSAGLNRTEP